MEQSSNQERAIVLAAFARIDAVAMGIAIGCVAALVVFAATAVLLVNASNSGAPVGPHLGLLRIYLPGYSVSWAGALIGAVYAWGIGVVVGLVLAWLWNLTHRMYIAAVMIRAMWWRFMD